MKLRNLISKAFGQVQSTNRTQIIPEMKDAAFEPMNTHLVHDNHGVLKGRIIEHVKFDISGDIDIKLSNKPIEKLNYINSKSKQLTNDIAMELLLLDEVEQIKILEATMGLIEAVKALGPVKRNDFRVLGAELKIKQNDNNRFNYGKFPNY